MLTKDQILAELAVFKLTTGGLGNWLTQNTDSEVFLRLGTLDKTPISKVQLNQLLAFGHEAPVSEDFFRYYWLAAPPEHPYDVKRLANFDASWLDSSSIVSLAHLKWGLNRIFVDGLLWFGNVRTAYRELRAFNSEELDRFFRSRRFNTDLIKGRGPALPLQTIAKDDRYLIAEMACKSYGEPGSSSDLKAALLESFHSHQKKGGGPIKIKDLLEGHFGAGRYTERQAEFTFSADDVLEDNVASEQELDMKFEGVAQKFLRAREAALKNTRLYLSMVGDLDVYVATSMRTRRDFREMATSCEQIFADPRLAGLQLRYFDPTMSAAAGHEDKGLIECLMVKCAKVLVYCAGEKDSYGKDAEAAMALSLGKPVIFYCDQEQKRRFFRDVHPLSRLIEFRTGVAVGAMATDSIEEVSELLHRIFENRMEYVLEQPKANYLRLKEKLTGSAVRLQTNDPMLTETFWNHYHNR
ncbi:MAG: hypothetical protein QOD09_421 [Bradyrhizobium sp.]|jgi:hypothetical protein|nr:hypothetical protein [Bradyrhizobium sp.]